MTVSVNGLDGVCEVIIARAARIAKLGARVGRFTKMVKMLRFLPGMGGEKAQGSAKVESARAVVVVVVVSRWGKTCRQLTAEKMYINVLSF